MSIEKLQYFIRKISVCIPCRCFSPRRHTRYILHSDHHHRHTLHHHPSPSVWKTPMPKKTSIGREGELQFLGTGLYNHSISTMAVLHMNIALKISYTMYTWQPLNQYCPPFLTLRATQEINHEAEGHTSRPKLKSND